jgi:hypothetical protein
VSVAPGPVLRWPDLRRVLSSIPLVWLPPPRSTPRPLARRYAKSNAARESLIEFSAPARSPCGDDSQIAPDATLPMPGSCAPWRHRGGRRGKRRARDPRGRHRSAFWHRPPYSSRSQPRAPRARACSRRTSPWLAVQLEQHDARHDEQAVGRVPRARAQLRPPRVMSSPRSGRRAAEHHPL